MMDNDPQIIALVDHLLESDCAAEEACRECPHLLVGVRKRLAEVRSMEARLAAASPPSDADSGELLSGPRQPPESPPDIPGYEMQAMIEFGGMGVVYKAHTSG